MNPAPYNRQPGHGHAGDSFGQVDTGDRLHSMHTPASVGTGTRIGDSVKAWTDTGPLPYRDDPLPPPWYWATDYYKRKRRRPRCDGED